MSPRFFLFLSFVLCLFAGPAFCEPITAAIISGSAVLLSGFMGLYGGMKGAEMSAAAQREANELSLSMWQDQHAEEKKRFNVAKALENLRLRLYKEDREFSKKEYLEDKRYQRMNDYANNLLSLSTRGEQRAITSQSRWAAQAQMPIQ